MSKEKTYVSKEVRREFYQVSFSEVGHGRSYDVRKLSSCSSC